MPCDHFPRKPRTAGKLRVGQGNVREIITDDTEEVFSLDGGIRELA